MKYRRRIPRRGSRPKVDSAHRPDCDHGPGPSWRSAAARRIRSSSTGSTELLPPDLELVHGPGCPVCVTPLETIDRAHAIASRPGCHLLLVWRHAPRAGLARRPAAAQVAGKRCAGRLFAAGCREPRRGADPDRQVVFFAIGFETTAPANAMAVWLAQKRRLTNFSMLVSHVLVPPPCRAFSSARQSRAGIPRPGPRLHGHGLHRIRADRSRSMACRS